MGIYGIQKKEKRIRKEKNIYMCVCVCVCVWGGWIRKKKRKKEKKKRSDSVYTENLKNQLLSQELGVSAENDKTAGSLKRTHRHLSPYKVSNKRFQIFGRSDFGVTTSLVSWFVLSPEKRADPENSHAAHYVLSSWISVHFNLFFVWLDHKYNVFTLILCVLRSQIQCLHFNLVCASITNTMFSL